MPSKLPTIIYDHFKLGFKNLISLEANCHATIKGHSSINIKICNRINLMFVL